MFFYCGSRLVGIVEPMIPEGNVSERSMLPLGITIVSLGRRNLEKTIDQSGMLIA